MQTLPLDQIVPNPNQPRKYFDEDALSELAASIRERGVMEPIVVRPKNGRYEIIAGERRFRASRLAGKPDIPVVIKELSDEEAFAESILENFQREDLTVIERARAIESLLEFMNVEDAARNLGCSPTTLRRSLELLELPESVQDELSLPPGKQALSGFTEGHARAIRALTSDYPTLLRVVEKIKKERLSIDSTTKLVEAIQKAPQRKEAFLRVSIDATEEILKRQGVKLARRKNFKRKTAAEFLSSYQKTVTNLSHLLDDEVTRYLNFEQMNQLLAGSTQLLDDLEKFVRAVRKDLLAQDFGFMETYIFCALCGRRELIGSLRCSVCGTVLKRCTDCGHYDTTYQQCGLHGFYVYGSEAESPSEESHSYRCPDYKPKVQVSRERAA